jgi:anti-sigma factor ChrR (cupin superfamily)
MLGIGFDEEETRLEKARVRLTEAAAVQHGVQLETIKEKADEIESTSAEVREAVENAVARSEFERRVRAGMTVIALGLGGTVAYIVRRRLKGR